MTRWAALAAVVLVGCGVAPAAPTPKPTPSAVTFDANDIAAALQTLAQDVAFLEAQGDSGLSIEAIRLFDRETGCTGGWSVAYWQEEQRAEEVVARVAAMEQLSLTYQYVAGALADALLPLPYIDSEGHEQVAEFVGVLVTANCP